jgi:hypothetical protein
MLYVQSQLGTMTKQFANNLQHNSHASHDFTQIMLTTMTHAKVAPFCAFALALVKAIAQSFAHVEATNFALTLITLHLHTYTLHHHSLKLQP